MKSLKFLIVLSVVGIVAGAPAKCDDAFPQPFDTETSPTKALAADEAAKKMQLPPGFRITVFASEPDVRQPIAMTTDARGRLWVAENYTYSERPTVFNDQLRDRILIFEDSDNDGRFDKRTVFWEGAQRLMGIEVGSGGVWALTLPNLVFIADADGDDVPDGQPSIILDGFDYQRGSHTVANSLRWGPDGWIYGRQGILTNSLVGPPGTPDGDRTHVNVGIWRFHPHRHAFENVAFGTTNPWGMDWDAKGEMFFINTVIGHLWHVIPGAHYRRMSGGDLDPRIYDVIEQHADHVHWATGEVWTDVRKGVTDATSEAGGGHAHTGLLIYQGGKWPEYWNGKLLTVNYHGKRLNVQRLDRDGTGYVGRREPDAFHSSDPWFRGLDLIAAPDGGVYLSDWSDTGECHDNDGIHRTSGRIYKITYGDTVAKIPDLNQQASVELARLQLSDNDWMARAGRRVLANRVAAGQPIEDATNELSIIMRESTDTVHRLRALWTLNQISVRRFGVLRSLLDDSDEHIRVWAIRLLEDQSHDSDESRQAFLDLARTKFSEMATQDSSGLVRLTLASMLQKLPHADRGQLAGALLSRGEDEHDHNQPLMLWCGILPLAENRDGVFEKLIAHSSIRQIQRYGARRLAEELEQSPSRIDGLLREIASQSSPEANAAVLDGVAEGLAGRRNPTEPPCWNEVRHEFAAGADTATMDRIRTFSAMFGSAAAIDELKAEALASDKTVLQRDAALRTLVDARVVDVASLCDMLLETPGLSLTAARGLALSNDPATASRLIELCQRIEVSQRAALVDVVISRPNWVAHVLDAIEAGQIDRNVLGAAQLRQIRNYKDRELTLRLNKLVGKDAASANPAKDDLIAKWKNRLSSEALSHADLTSGQQVFRTSCGICHRLNGEGHTIGPDLTGAARDNIHYLLENILTPSAVLAEEYRQVTVLLEDGRVLVGTVKPGANDSIQLQTTTQLVTLSRDEIEEQTVAPISMMPEGLLDVLSESQARNLFAYLMSKSSPPSEN